MSFRERAPMLDTIIILQLSQGGQAARLAQQAAGGETRTACSEVVGGGGSRGGENGCISCACGRAGWAYRDTQA
jgi:hypothetical protein